MIRDRWHNGAGHGFFLNPAFCKRYWFPFLRDGTFVSGAATPQSPSFPIRLLSVLKIKYLVLTACILFGATQYKAVAGAIQPLANIASRYFAGPNPPGPVSSVACDYKFEDTEKRVTAAPSDDYEMRYHVRVGCPRKDPQYRQQVTLDTDGAEHLASEENDKLLANCCPAKSNDAPAVAEERAYFTFLVAFRKNSSPGIRRKVNLYWPDVLGSELRLLQDAPANLPVIPPPAIPRPAIPTPAIPTPLVVRDPHDHTGVAPTLISEGRPTRASGAGGSGSAAVDGCIKSGCNWNSTGSPPQEIGIIFDGESDLQTIVLHPESPYPVVARILITGTRVDGTVVELESLTNQNLSGRSRSITIGVLGRGLKSVTIKTLSHAPDAWVSWQEIQVYGWPVVRRP